MKTNVITLLIALSIYCSSASAELSLCNGVWTNAKCDSEAANVLKEKESVAPPKPVVEKQKKEYALHELLMHQVKAKREYGIDIFVNDVIDECRNTDIDPQNCNKLVGERYLEITKLVEEAKKSKPIQSEEQKTTLNEQPSTVVVQPSRTVVVPVHRDPYRREYSRSRESVKIDYNKESGVSVSVEAGNTSVNQRSTSTLRKDSRERGARPVEAKSAEGRLAN
jgi:hypothetical protein